MAFHSKYICQQCGYESTGWMGKCPECGTWNSLVETIVQSTQNKVHSKNSKSVSQLISKPVNLSDIKSSSLNRTSTNISELDRVLGGGLVPGQVILIAGEPGIGKSTLLTQLADSLGIRHKALGNSDNLEKNSSNAQSLVPSASVLYVCGEESPQQVAIRAKRLGVTSKNIQMLEETDVDTVVNQLISESVNQYSAVIVDSIQTMSTTDLSGMAGSVGQVRECAFRLSKIAKEKNIPLFLVGHVTKEGTVAGPAVLAHLVAGRNGH